MISFPQLSLGTRDTSNQNFKYIDESKGNKKIINGKPASLRSKILMKAKPVNAFYNMYVR